MPVPILCDLTQHDYMERISSIKKSIADVESKLEEVPTIKVIGKIGTQICDKPILPKPASNMCIPMRILESKIKKINAKKKSSSDVSDIQKTEKTENIENIGNIESAASSMLKIDGNNCEWNELSRRSQRSAVIRYCNSKKILHPFDKDTLSKMKTESWNTIKANEGIYVDYSPDDEMIVDLPFLKIKDSKFEIRLNDDEVVPPSPKDLKIKIKKKLISKLTMDHE